VALDGQGLLVEWLQRRGVLGQHPPHPTQRSLLGVKATKPVDVPAGSQAGSQPTAASRALPLVDQQGCC
jgi:hypothetical protein